MKIHQLAALLVLLASAAWVLTGEFSSVGSAAVEGAENTVAARQKADEVQKPRALQAVTVAQVPSFDHARSVRISGVTKPDKKTQLTARANGVVENLAVIQGQVVKKGDLILTLGSEGRDAVLASAKQALDQAKISADAKQRLVKNGTIPSQQLDQALSALRAAESQVEAAQAELDRLKIVAAFDGVIDDVMVELGGAVQPGTPVATLIALNPIIGLGEVNEGDLSAVRVGEEAELRLVTGPVVKGTVRFISREANAQTRTYSVEIEVPNPDLSVPAGMTTEVILRGTPVSAKPVPRSIVTLDRDGALGIRGVDADNKVVFYPIDIVDDSTGALILGGIPEDARIIVSGQNLVSDGQQVDVVDADKALIDRLVAEARAQIEVK
ncbi:MAG: efflux RND transporter periplasmic adaptor subunit [Ahrensia sp.]|nr:efflux RND transporter periplasmic adaptor subunit [Ahrensia sp.]